MVLCFQSLRAVMVIEPLTSTWTKSLCSNYLCRRCSQWVSTEQVTSLGSLLNAGNIAEVFPLLWPLCEIV